VQKSFKEKYGWDKFFNVGNLSKKYSFKFDEQVLLKVNTIKVIWNEILETMIYTLLIKDGDSYYGKNCGLY
jgi:hypothetical protein